MKARHLFIRCDTCAPSTRPGLLWLGGGDWVECPRGCVNGRIELVEEQVKPRGQGFIVGSTKGFTLPAPAYSRRFG